MSTFPTTRAGSLARGDGGVAVHQAGPTELAGLLLSLRAPYFNSNSVLVTPGAGLLRSFWRSIYVLGNSSWEVILEGPPSSGLRECRSQTP